MRPLGLGKKAPVYKDPAVRWLMQLSKAALADCVVDLLRPSQESADDPVSEDAAYERLAAVLAVRGDKPPKTTKQVSDAEYNKIYSRSHGEIPHEVNTGADDEEEYPA